MLPGPFGWHVAEPGNTDAARQTSVKHGLNERWGDKRKRDGHIDLARAAAFALGNDFDRRPWIDGEFTEPPSTSRDGLDQGGARLRPDRANVG